MSHMGQQMVLHLGGFITNRTLKELTAKDHGNHIFSSSSHPLKTNVVHVFHFESTRRIGCFIIEELQNHHVVYNTNVEFGSNWIFPTVVGISSIFLDHTAFIEHHYLSSIQ